MSNPIHKPGHHKSIKFILLALLLLESATMTGQEIPKFGKVSKEELLLTEFPQAPDADAVYLFDVGDMRIMDDFTLQLKRQVRIKILTEEGKEEANIRIPYWHEDEIYDLKGHTITPKGKKVKLKEVFDEEEKDWKYKVFTLPGVEVGSVLEYKYELSTDYIHYLQPWYFQHPQFTKLSQLSAVVLPGFSYNVFFNNVVDVERTEEESIEPGRKLKKFTWKLEDLPPIREEPYMSTLEDYMAALHFQLISFKSPYANYRWINSWSELTEKVRERYNDFLNEESQLGAILPVALESELDTAKALYDYVREKIESASRGYLYPQDRPEEVLKKRNGTGAEKNTLLINLLKNAGIKAYPLLISTRSNGKILTKVPNLDQFNYVLAYFKIGGKSYVLDTYRKYCPFELLPTYSLVEQGLLIDDGEGQFVELPLPRGTNMAHCETEAFIDEEGNLTGASTIRYDNYQGYFARDDVTDSGEEEFLKKVLTERFGEVEIDSFKIVDLDRIENPLYVKVSYRVKGFAQVSGDMIYVGTPTFHHQRSNPFKRENRYFPVEFLYSSASTDNVTLSIPKGFRIDEIPKNVVRSDNDMSFGITFDASDQTIQIQRQYLRHKITFSVREYHELRNYFDMMIKADQSQIVLINDKVLSGSNE
jgi:transglutaminase-like putative cysteine protease